MPSFWKISIIRNTPTRSPNSRSVMVARLFFVTAFFGCERLFSCCSEPAAPRSSGQVSKATQGVTAIRAPSGHLIGILFLFIIPSAKLKRNCFRYTNTNERPLPTAEGFLPRECNMIRLYQEAGCLGKLAIFRAAPVSSRMCIPVLARSTM